MASVSDSDISEAESIIEDRDDGTSLRGRDGVGPPGYEKGSKNAQKIIFCNFRKEFSTLDWRLAPPLEPGVVPSPNSAILVLFETPAPVSV